MLSRTMTNDDFAMATKCIASGDGDEAAALCMRLWLAERNESDAMALTRTLLPKLFTRHPSARMQFTRLREDYSARLDDPFTRLRWVQLCEALGDGATVLRWLDDTAPGSVATRFVAFDLHVQRFVEETRSWASLARHVEQEEAEKHARVFVHELSKAVSKDELRRTVDIGLTSMFMTPRKALLQVGRADDEAKLGALIQLVAKETIIH